MAHHQRVSGNPVLFQRPTSMLRLRSTHAKHLFDLPPELLEHILQFLELDHMWILGQTCLSFHRRLTAICKSRIPLIPFYTRRDFWCVIASVLGDYYFCTSCFNLHRVDTEDLPTQAIDRMKKCHLRISRWLEQPYLLRPHHVQLALDLTERNDDIYRDYLQALMRPHSQTITTSAAPTLRKSHYAEPKIVDGNFLLHTEWHYRDDNVINFSKVEDVQICGHLKVASPTDSPRATWTLCRPRHTMKFYTAMSRALRMKNRGREMTGHCAHYKMDWSLIVNCGSWRLRAWIDLGSTESWGDDMSWTRHVGHTGCEGPSY